MNIVDNFGAVVIVGLTTNEKIGNVEPTTQELFKSLFRVTNTIFYHFLLEPGNQSFHHYYSEMFNTLNTFFRLVFTYQRSNTQLKYFRSCIGFLKDQRKNNFPV